MKLQYGILGMVLVSGASFAHNHEEVAEGITVGGYVDARYTWMNGDKDAGEGMSMFNLPEGALVVGKRVGTARVFVDAGFSAATDLTLKQGYVSHATDSGLSWKAGKFDSIYGWYSNHSSDNTLSTSGILHADGYHHGLLFGYNFSDMMALHLVVDANQAASDRTVAANGNMDSPGFGVKLDSKMDAFTLALGYYMAKESNATDAESMWDLDVVAGTKFADYDFKATFLMGKETADFNSMGFGAEIGGSVADAVSAAARFEWLKNGEESTKLAFAVGPQFNIEKGFDVKADFGYTLDGGDANPDAEAEMVINLAAIYSF